MQVRVDDELEVGPAVEAATYRIVAEGLANVAKHARATLVTVEVTRSGTDLTVVVEDDGVGLDERRFGSNGGLGLGSMRERAEELGGRLTVTAGTRNRGTRVTAILPLDRTEER